MQNYKKHFENLIKKIEEKNEKVLKTKKFNKSTAASKILSELIKEQNTNENSNTSTGEIR